MRLISTHLGSPSTYVSVTCFFTQSTTSWKWPAASRCPRLAARGGLTAAAWRRWVLGLSLACRWFGQSCTDASPNRPWRLCPCLGALLSQTWNRWVESGVSLSFGEPLLPEPCKRPHQVPLRRTLGAVFRRPSRRRGAAISSSPRPIGEKDSLLGAILYFLVSCVYGPFYLEGGGFLLPIFCFYFYCVLSFFFPSIDSGCKSFIFYYGANTYFLLPCHLALNFAYDVLSPSLSV